MTENKNNKKYIEKIDYLELRVLQLGRSLEDKDLELENFRMMNNELRIRLHRSESEKNAHVATLLKYEERTMKDRIEHIQDKIKDCEVEHENFVSLIEKEKGVKLKDHTINPKTLEVKPILSTRK